MSVIERIRTNGLPDLVGSGAQVHWAENIRKPVLADLIPLLALADEKLQESPSKYRDLRDMIIQVGSYIIDQDDASWWIGHRHLGRNLRYLLAVTEFKIKNPERVRRRDGVD